MYLPTIAQLDAAATTVYAAMAPTAQYSWPMLGALLGEYLGTEVRVKHENHTPTGAFKVRGGQLAGMERLEGRKIGLPLSGGNVDAGVFAQVLRETGHE